MRGAFDLGIDGTVSNLGADDRLEEGNGLLMASLLEHHLPECHPSPSQQHEILGSDGGVDGIAESGLGELFLPTGEQLLGALDVFEGLHEHSGAGRAQVG